MKKTTEQIDEDSPLFKELEAEANKESARLACLLSYYSNDSYLENSNKYRK